jgi:hypothetical protein
MAKVSLLVAEVERGEDTGMRREEQLLHGVLMDEDMLKIELVPWLNECEDEGINQSNE